MIAVKGQLCGIKAWKLAEDSRFSSASHLRSKYQALRKQELALLNDALKDVRKWADILKSEDRLEDGLSAALFPDDERDEEGLLYIMVLERLAWAEYFRPDQIDPAQAKAEQCSGLEHVLSSYTGSFWSAAINAIVRDYNDLSAQARIFYATGEYAQARVWIEKALHLGEAGIHVTFDLPDDVDSYGYNPQMVIALDSSRLLALGWKPTTALREMFLRSAASMADAGRSGS